MRTCKKCGAEIAENDVIKSYPSLCRECYKKYRREHDAKRREKIKEETGYSYTKKEREYRNAYCTKQRIKAKMETGKTYRSKREAERSRKYAREHVKKTSELTQEQLERRKKSGKRYYYRKKTIDFVNDCDGLDFNIFNDVL